MDSQRLADILPLANFFFLAFALLVVYYYAYRLRTELKRSDFLRKETEKYRDLFNATTEGVFQFNADGRFTIMNHSGANLLGYESPQELLSDNVNVFRFLYDQTDKKSVCDLLRKKNRIQRHSLKILTKKGILLYIDLTLHVISDENGKTVGYEGIFHDVTDRVALEEELWNYSNNLETMVQSKTEEILNLERKKFHLEKLAAVGQMAAALVHELRNPLSSVKMGMMTLANRAKLEEPERRVLDVALKEGRRLERMLKEVLDFSRPQELHLIRQDVHPILDRAVEQMAFDLSGNGIVLFKEYDPNAPPIMVDSERMNQVVVNLLQNAKDAIHKSNGRLTLRFKLSDTGTEVRLEVIDNGGGIRKADLQHVFEPFFSKKASGTGLGLTVVQKIVEAHKGRITVESRYGRGTKIKVELPVDRTD
jgi:PAS domain S-box-containing protein